MEQNYNKLRLFIGSCFALLVTALTFAMRAKIEEIFGPVEEGGIFGLSKEAIGWAFSPAFWGFTIAMVLGGFVIDIVKTKTLVWTAFILQLIGAIVFILAKNKEVLFIANVFIGLGNGTVEAAFNPLVATIYPKDKTRMLNRFHVWFPAGIVIGSLLAYFMMDNMDISWQIYAALLFIPLAIYGVIFLGQKIPETERVTSGVSYKGMMMAVGAPFTIIISMTLMILLATKVINFPEGWMYLALIGLVSLISILEALLVHKEKAIFPIMFSLMLLTSSTELVTNQWVNALLGGAVESAILLLALISTIMALGRFFAGQLIHRINPVGVLLMSSIFAALGIYVLSFVSSSSMTVVGAVLFAIGITYFWPTMLGFCSEYIPRTGALGLSLLGGAGFVSASMFMPVMGKILEENDTSVALRSMGILPILMIIGFAVLYVLYRKKKPEVL